MLRLLPLVAIAFKIWLAVDASKRRVPSWWLWVILLLPFGDVIYFFTYKIHDLKLGKLGERLRRPPSAAEVRQRFELTPSLENRVLLGQALYDAGSYREAESCFAEALERESENPDALHGLGLARIGRGDWAGAIEPLERLIETDRAYADYVAWGELAYAYHRQGRTAESVTLLERLVATSPRFSHGLLLAKFLIEADRYVEATRALEQAFEEQESAPSFVRRKDRALEREGRTILKQLKAKTDAEGPSPA